MKYDVIVIGSGFAGSVIANKFASDDKKVLIIEKRNHIGGNMYDFKDEMEVIYHKYGPHIFHTNSDKVVEYLSNFTEFFKYEHKVLGLVDNKLVPIPFNLKSIEILFSKEKADKLKNILINTYGLETKVPILKLKENKDEDIRNLAEYIYEKVFKYYTMKQWDLKPEEIDPKVTERVPVHISYDDRYFQDKYQMMPKNGYTFIFENMLKNENIDVILNTDCKEHIKLENGKIYYNNNLFKGKLIYTGAIDELFDYCLGELPYRSVDFDIKHFDKTYQETGTINYPTPKKENPYTRITEYKHLMENKPEKTTIAIEYSYPYDKTAQKGNIPYYPIFKEDVINKYNEYVEISKQYKNLYLLGRLAQFRYFNMDAIIETALNLYDEIKED